MRKLNFDASEQRAIIFDGKTYNVRVKTFEDEAGEVRKHREAIAKLAERGKNLLPGDKKSVNTLKREEVDLMADLICHFCPIDRDALLTLPVRLFYAAYIYVLGGGIDPTPLNADKYRLAGTYQFKGKEYEVKAIGVGDSLIMHDICDSKLSPAEKSGDSEARFAALFEIISMCLDADSDEFYKELPEVGVVELARIIVANAHSGDEGDEKNG